jgi:hypothetical protein
LFRLFPVPSLLEGEKRGTGEQIRPLFPLLFPGERLYFHEVRCFVVPPFVPGGQGGNRPIFLFLHFRLKCPWVSRFIVPPFLRGLASVSQALISAGLTAQPEAMVADHWVFPRPRRCPVWVIADLLGLDQGNSTGICGSVSSASMTPLL